MGKPFRKLDLRVLLKHPHPDPPPQSAAEGEENHPRRFAFTAIDSSTRWAMTAASDACLRISSAAVAS